jgi:LuxR family maltose regulon positive regulatory protein
MPSGDETELARLPAGIAVYRAALALIRGDLSTALEKAQLSTDLAAADDHVLRAAAAGISGLAYWAGGDLEAAHRAYSACADGLQRAGHIPDVLGCAVALADIRITQGRLGDALRTLDQALLLAGRQGGGVAMRGMPDMYVGLSQIACERGDLEVATEHLDHSNEFGEHMGLPQNAYRWRVAMARIREAEGDLPGALALVEEAQRVYVSDFFPDVRPVAALRARLLAANGDVSHALGWARDRGVSTSDTLTYIREFEHTTLARILLAQFGEERDQDLLRHVTDLLDRLLAAAEAGGRTGSVIEILTLQAHARHGAGDTSGALTSLERALTLAEPEGYVRVFLGAGSPVLSLLAAILRQRPVWDYVRRVLATAAPDDGAATEKRAADSGLARPGGLVDHLSERELDVLRLLATDLDGPHIARRLIVSLNTVRTHTKSIYAKLGVNSRRAAVRRATELGLLPRTHDQ